LFVLPSRIGLRPAWRLRTRMSVPTMTVLMKFD